MSLNQKSMSSIAQMARTAAAALQQVAETEPGDRGRRAGAGALVLRAAALRLEGAAGAAFVLARADEEVAGLPGGPERAVLRRLIEYFEEPEGAARAELIAHALLEYAYQLEKGGRLAEADAALALARSAAPRDPELALHAGRIARKLDDRSRAAELYGVARELDAPCGRFARLAAIGEALLSAEPERALGRAIRQAVLARDAEAAAVGLEERALVRRGAGDRPGAMRDLCAAATRFADPVDRARAAHELADLAVAAGDPLAAREALLVALEAGDAAQRVHARTRLYSLSRGMGDQLGMRRWRPAKRAALVSLSMFRLGRTGMSAAPVLARWRGRLERRFSQATV